MTPTIVTAALDAALRGAAIVLLSVLAVVVLRDRGRSTLGRIAAPFMAGLVVQAVSSSPTFEALAPRAWQAPLVGISIANAMLFWLLVEALFDDDFRPRPRHAVLWLAIAAAGFHDVLAGWQSSSTLGRIPILVARLAPPVFAALAVVAAGSTWRADLIEGRRRLRVVIVVGGVGYCVAQLAMRWASPRATLSTDAAVVDAGMQAALLVAVTIGALRVSPSEVLAPEPVAAPSARGTAIADAADDAADDDAPSDDADSDLAAALQRAMRDDRAYRTEGMTLAVLAKRLAVPEYRLRRLINHRLGHRNFNAFINAFRLDEAREALADPAQRDLPVLTIALTAGFQSIGPFNRAFKATTGMTPTEFRKRPRPEHRADS